MSDTDICFMTHTYTVFIQQIVYYVKTHSQTAAAVLPKEH